MKTALHGQYFFFFDGSIDQPALVETQRSIPENADRIIINDNRVFEFLNKESS